MEISFSGGYQQFWKAIVRPPRDDYSLGHMGSKNLSFKGVKVLRKDFTVVNTRGFKLQCSHFDIESGSRSSAKLPCVIFLHGNASSRLEGMAYLSDLIPKGITVCVFDFSGCGHSQGEYISLGWFERDDVNVVIKYLSENSYVSEIGLWGRSMGAATAIMYSAENPRISAIVVDSPFASLSEICNELCGTYAKIPSFIVKGALSLIRKTISKEVGFDIYKNNPKDFAARIKNPIFMIHGKDDDFIFPHHSHQIFKVIPTSTTKNIKMVEGDHNSQRDKIDIADIVSFFCFHLHSNKMPIDKGMAHKNLEEKANKNPIFSENHIDKEFFEDRRKQLGIQSSVFMSKMLKAEEKDIEAISKEAFIKEKEEKYGPSGYPIIDDSPEFQNMVKQSIFEFKKLKSCNHSQNFPVQNQNPASNSISSYPSLD